MPALVLAASDLGRLVTVRARTSLGPVDVVGTLESISAASLTLRRRDGTEVTFAVTDVTHARVVPPSPAQTVGVDELETLMLDGWRALEQDRLGEWVVRASGGFTRRGNSALPVGDPGLPLPAALAELTRWYAVRRLPPRLQLPVHASTAPLAEALAAAGWERDVDVHVMTAELAPVLRGPAAPRVAGLRVDLASAPDEAWLATYRQDAGPLPQVARDLLTNHPRAVFASVSEGGDCVAVARAAVDGRWAGLFAVEVTPASRGRGLGTAVSLAALRWAAGQGARRAYLQVETGNAPAIDLYTRLGFTVHHDYAHYVDRKPQARASTVET